jgi:molybdate transport system regulatory protein
VTRSLSLSIRVRTADGRRLGPGKIRLLELIAETGSIAAAGRRMRMSYRRAWALVGEMNAELPHPVVAARTGGSRGGGAALTAYAEDLVARYRAVEADAADRAARDLADLLDSDAG